MLINNVHFNADLETVLYELQAQLFINHIYLLQKIRDSGDNIMIQCPYHGNGQERKPSAGIRKSDGLFHCFACGETHSLQEVISHCFGKADDLLGTFGWTWLLKNFATMQIEERKDVEIDFERANVSSKTNVGDSKLDISNNSKSVYITEEELDSYRYYHPYWAKRGITNENIIELFDLGYDSKTDCITFPVRDIKGNCLFVARRNVKTKFFNYPKGVEKPLYGLYEYHKFIHDKTYVGRYDGQEITSGKYAEWEKSVIVCESMIDCILLWQAGHYAVALNGLGNALQFNQLNKLPCRHIILATDNDEAGQDARKRIRQEINNKLITEIEFPKGVKDIGECTKEQVRDILNWEVF